MPEKDRQHLPSNEEILSKLESSGPIGPSGGLEYNLEQTKIGRFQVKSMLKVQETMVNLDKTNKKLTCVNTVLAFIGVLIAIVGVLLTAVSLWPR